MSSNESLTAAALDETRAISKEAFIFFRSLIDQYQMKMRFIHLPHNQFYLPPDNPPQNIGYQSKDQLYSIAFLDMKEEPIVLTTPTVNSNYLFSIMCTDPWGNNFAYFGSRTTGNDSAAHLITGPGWSKSIPDTIDKCVTAESYYVTVIARLELKDPDDPNDVQYVKDMLRACDLQPLSSYLQGAPVSILPRNQPDFPSFDENVLTTAGVFKYVNFFTAFIWIHPTEKQFFDQFAKIGVYPGAPFPPINVNPSFYEAIDQGVWEGHKAVLSERERQTSNKIGGWSYVCGINPPLIGERSVMQYRYIARAAMAQSTFEWGNNKEEAFYMQARQDKDGEDLSGDKVYELVWSEDDIPKVNGFWSITMYDENGVYIEGAPITSVGTNTNLIYEPDNGLIIKLQPTDPGQGTNWLPTPTAGPFQLFMRIYSPMDEIVDGTYAPPLPSVITS